MSPRPNRPDCTLEYLALCELTRADAFTRSRKQCFPHIDFTWAGRPSIFGDTFLLSLTLYFFIFFIFSLFFFIFLSFPVAQMVEHGASNAKIMGSIPRESKS